MANNITRKVLEEKVNRLNNKVNSDISKVELDYAACYGGYCLTSNNGSHHVTHRMPAKEMNQYLNGALDWISCFPKEYESKVYDGKEVMDNGWTLDGLNPVGTITIEVEDCYPNDNYDSEGNWIGNVSNENGWTP
jgi:hypothetical protein